MDSDVKVTTENMDVGRGKAKAFKEEKNTAQIKPATTSNNTPPSTSSQKKIFNKKPLTTEQLMKKLAGQGLIFPTDAEARRRCERQLETIGYFRLREYCLPFMERVTDKAGNSGCKKHFQPGTTFDDVIALYQFDSELRLHLLKAIEHIEIAVRNAWVTLMLNMADDPHAWCDPRRSQHIVKNPWLQQKLLHRLASNLKDSSEVFVKHYRKHYEIPFLPPVWIAVEVMTFGELSQWLSNTQAGKLKRQLAREFGLPTIESLESVLQHLALVRNTCAHHARTWNRRYTKRLPIIKRLQPALTTEQTQNNHPTQPGANRAAQVRTSNTLNNSFIIIQHLLNRLGQFTEWQPGLQRLLARIPARFLPFMGLNLQKQSDSKPEK